MHQPADTRQVRTFRSVRHRAVWLLAGGLLGALPAAAQIAAPSGGAPPPEACAARFDVKPRGSHQERIGQPFVINAEEVDLARIGQSEFVGSVELRRADQQLETGHLIYDKSIGAILLPEALRYNDADYIVDADSARYLIDDGTAAFDTVRFQVKGSTANGTADSVEIQRGGLARGRDLHFTTCPNEVPSWELVASSVKLDRDRGVGTARNATLKFKQVPVLWLPWLSFPLDDRRKSGFLYPKLSTTSENGFTFEIPYYWNIAPNADFTVTPRVLTDRGPGIGGEFRYLTHRAGGQFDVDYLPSDDKFGSDRHRWHAQSAYQIARKWRVDVNASRVSDKDYFLDFSNNINESTVQFLQSQLTLRGGGTGWNLLFLADTFQVLDRSVGEDREPFRRLPRLAVDGRWPLYGTIDFTLDSEVVYFDRDSGLNGGRIDLTPALEWQIIRPGWFLKPRAAARYTGYTLSNNGELPDSPDRALPIMSIDGGLIFENGLDNGDRVTLEPRLFYLYVPFEEQSDLPNFDSNDLTFGFSELFSTNGFTGADRQSNANSLSMAVTSRYIDGKSGRQVLDVSIGTAFFFRSPRVAARDEEIVDLDTQPIITEVNWRPLDRWTVNAGLQWDPEEAHTDVALAGFTYTARHGARWQAGYRFRRNKVDQFDLRVSYPLTDKWRFLGRWNYSLRDDETLEAVGGIEYESCCWAIQVVARRFVNDRGGASSTGVFIELHLKGLGSLGRNPYDLFAANRDPHSGR